LAQRGSDHAHRVGLSTSIYESSGVHFPELPRWFWPRCA